jgi:hypothetical protein
MPSHKYVSISSGRHWNTYQEERFFNDVIKIAIPDEKYYYEIRSGDIWEGSIPYMRNDGMDFYSKAKELAKQIEKNILEANTLGERDNLIYNKMSGVATSNNICLVTNKIENLSYYDDEDDEKANEAYKNNILSIPLKTMNFDSKWSAGKPVKDNIIHLFQGYIPTFFLWGLFKHKENILKAKQIIHHLTNNNLDDQQTLAYLQDIVKNFSPENPCGEFNRKLHYIIRKLQNPTLQPVQLAQPQVDISTLNIRVNV